ncbi:MAG TPA: hypothetical protein VND45_09890 [Thermoanaerobaculia bacterium]|nr:hypothetical protein [Thermoanaerobaculia bacterium]
MRELYLAVHPAALEFARVFVPRSSSCALPNVFVHVLPVTLGMALTTTWACPTLRFFETRSAKYAAWMGVWLKPAIAARPNLAISCRSWR